MSTKIYYGFQFKDHSLIDEAFDTLRAIRPKFVKYAGQLFNDVVVRNATFLYDKEESLNYRSPLTHAQFELSDRLSKKENVYIGNYESEILVGKVHNLILGYYNLPNELIKLFKKEKFFKEYGYWNNTDKLPRVSNKEWKIRGTNWDAMFNGEFYLHKSMFSFKLIEHDDYTYVNDQKYKKSSIPPDNIRLDILADFKVRQKYSELLNSYAQNGDFFKVINFARTTEYKTDFETIRKEIVLKPVSIDLLKESNK